MDRRFEGKGSPDISIIVRRPLPALPSCRMMPGRRLLVVLLLSLLVERAVVVRVFVPHALGILVWLCVWGFVPARPSRERKENGGAWEGRAVASCRPLVCTRACAILDVGAFIGVSFCSPPRVCCQGHHLIREATTCDGLTVPPSLCAQVLFIQFTHPLILLSPYPPLPPPHLHAHTQAFTTPTTNPRGVC